MTPLVLIQLSSSTAPVFKPEWATNANTMIITPSPDVLPK